MEWVWEVHFVIAVDRWRCSRDPYSMEYLCWLVVVGVHRSSPVGHRYSSVFVAWTSKMSFAPPTLRPPKCPTFRRHDVLHSSAHAKEALWQRCWIIPLWWSGNRCCFCICSAAVIGLDILFNALKRGFGFMFSACSSSCYYMLAHRRMIALMARFHSAHSIGNPLAKINTQGNPLSRSLNSYAIERLRFSVPIGYHSQLVKTDCSYGKLEISNRAPGVSSANLWKTLRVYHRFFFYVVRFGAGWPWMGNSQFPTGSSGLDKPYLCAFRLIAR